MTRLISIVHIRLILGNIEGRLSINGWAKRSMTRGSIELRTWRCKSNRIQLGRNGGLRCCHCCHWLAVPTKPPNSDLRLNPGHWECDFWMLWTWLWLCLGRNLIWLARLGSLCWFVLKPWHWIYWPWKEIDSHGGSSHSGWKSWGSCTMAGGCATFCVRHSEIQTQWSSWRWFAASYAQPPGKSLATVCHVRYNIDIVIAAC